MNFCRKKLPQETYPKLGDVQVGDVFTFITHEPTPTPYMKAASLGGEGSTIVHLCSGTCYMNQSNESFVKIFPTALLTF